MAHRWNYERPNCMWEEMPYWLRWPAAFALAVYFGGGLLAGTIALLR